jgi:Calcineurin-like phosphoesterase
MRPSTSDADFIAMVEQHGGSGTAKRLGLNVRTIFARKRYLEKKLGRQIFTPIATPANVVRLEPYPHRAELKITKGVIIVASDAHYWPGPPSLMHRALVKFCKDMKPVAVVFNGDVIDAPQISRFLPIGWTHRPNLSDEIEATKDRLHEIELAAFKSTKIWCIGNHDQRFETRIATVAPEYANVHGTRLHDHFPNWRTAWACWINDEIVIKHRFRGGMHAVHNNTLWSGKTIITGHLHSAKVTPFDDYNGTRYGVDGGCIAETDAKAFTDYTEDNPKNWRSAFCVLTFKESRLLQPELVLKFDNDRVQFRGEIIKC